MDDFTIVNLQDLTTATGLTENDFLAIGQGSNALTKATIQQVGVFLGVSSSVVIGDKDVEPTVPSFAFAEAGTYPEWGNTEIEGDLGILIYDGANFSKTEINFIANGVVEEGNTQAVSGGEVYDSLKPTQELNDRQNLQNTNYFNKIGFFLSKNNGNEGTSSNRKCTPFLFINPLEDIIVTGYDGADTGTTSLCNFYDSNKVFLGTFTTGETEGQKNNVLISKDFISANYPTAIFIRCSASTAQLDASVYGITNTKALDYFDAEISNINALDLLLQDTIPNSSESVTITDGRVTRVMNYTLDETPVYIRQIDYTYNTNEIVEIRQLNQPYIKLQKKTNLTTLNTEVTWL